MHNGVCQLFNDIYRDILNDNARPYVVSFNHVFF